jgi:plasmid stabilization system protein ParE
MGEIKWTKKASSNLQAIFDYISRDSKIYAAKYVKALINATKKLETMPRSGRMVPEFEKKYDSQFRIVFDAIRQLKSSFWVGPSYVANI